MTNESDRQFPFIAQPKPAPDAMRLDTKTIQTLLDLLNPLHGGLDYQIHINSEGEHVYDAPPDYEHSVTVLAQQERDLTQAVLILEDRKRSAPVPPADEAKRCDCQNPGICAHEGRCIDKPLSPSGTVAAEPVASEFCERCNERLINGQNIFATKTGIVHFPKCPLIREDREAAVYTVLTKFLPKDATLDTLFQELKEALRDAQ